MENNRDSYDLRKIRRRNLLLSVVACLICMAALLLPMREKVYKAYSFESAVEINVSAARSAYIETGSNEDLYSLALALCREAYLQGESFDPAELRSCGLELYRRAKEKTLDLEKIGDPTDTTAMIDLLKDFGVTAVDS